MTRNSKPAAVHISFHPGYLVSPIISKFVIAITISSLYVRLNWDQPTSGLAIVPTWIIILGVSYQHYYWGPIRSKQNFVHWYILILFFGSWNTIIIFDHLYFGDCHCIYFHLSQRYICYTYNLISGPVNFFVTCHLLTIQFRMK